MIRKIYLSGVLLILLASVFSLYGQYAVYRYPSLTVDPDLRPQLTQRNKHHTVSAQGAYLKTTRLSLFRAFTPDTTLTFDNQMDDETLRVEIENIHPLAQLQSSGISINQVEQQQTGLKRSIQIAPPYAKHFSLSWVFPEKERYRFVAIGDTGGDMELSWGLQRAAQLKADFILHMGDAYYDVSEIAEISARLNASAVPIYTANGNHDFQGPAGNAIEIFLQDIGPLNAKFRLLGHCVINLDTGAFMYPANRGARAAMLAAEVVNHRRNPQQCSDYIVFTHKPLLDKFEAEFPQRDHSLYGRHARPLIKQLQQLGKVTVIAGHIHNDFEFEQDGFKTFVTGSGLAHRDLLSGKQDAKVLVGVLEAGKRTEFSWEFNQMPQQYHCSKRFYRGLLEAKNPLSSVIEQQCLRE